MRASERTLDVLVVAGPDAGLISVKRRIMVNEDRRAVVARYRRDGISAGYSSAGKNSGFAFTDRLGLSVRGIREREEAARRRPIVRELPAGSSGARNYAAEKLLGGCAATTR